MLLRLLGSYAKAVTALVGALIAWGTAVVVSPSSQITSGEWIELAAAVAVALGVLAVPNSTGGTS
jgi:hypothetical protein